MATPVYIAGCWHQREAIRTIMDRAEALGCRITHDWTTFETSYTDRHERSRRCALADIEGVLASRILIVLLTDDKYAYRGTSSEVGAALAIRAHTGGRTPAIWVVASADPRTTDEGSLPYCLTSCFMHTADEYFPTVDAMFEELAKTTAAPAS